LFIKFYPKYGNKFAQGGIEHLFKKTD